jgi:hypothetical protein
MKSLYKLDDGRTSGGHAVEAFVFLEEGPVPLGDQVGPKGDLIDETKPQSAHHADQLLGFGIDELGGETRCDTGGDGIPFLQDMPDVIDGAEHMFCILAANTDTISAADTSFSNDLRLAGRDANRFCRALANTGITHPASFPNGGHEGFGV